MMNAGSRSSASPEVPEICSLIDGGDRCLSRATAATYNKRLLKDILPRRPRFYPDPEAGHVFICERHCSVLQSMRAKRKRKDSEEENDYQPEVDFLQLQMNTLRRYKRHYRLQLKPGTNKIQLVEAISKHFRSIRVSEKKTVPLFISMVKSHKSKLDQPKPPDTS